MNGFMGVHIVAEGFDLVCYQKIVDGQVVGWVGADGNWVLIPRVREEFPVSGELLDRTPLMPEV